MNEETPKVFELDVKDLVCFILKHVRTLFLVSIAFAIVGAGFSVFKQSRVNSVVETNVLNINSKLSGESDEEFNNRVANVERANNIIDNISVLTHQVEIQNDYINNSVYMQIDPLNVANTSIQVVLTCDNNNVGGLESLYNAYMDDIAMGDYISDVAKELGYSVGATQELISISFETSVSANTDSLNQMGVMTVSVIGESVDDTDLIMDAIVAELDNRSVEFKSSIVSHTMSIIGRHTSVGFDSEVRQIQFDSVSMLNTLQTQINNLNNNLDNIAKSLGLKDRMSFFVPVSVATTESGISIKGVVKYAVLGFVLGFALIACLYILCYLFGRRVISQKQFFSLFDVAKIGVYKPLGKRNKLQVSLDQWSDDDNSLTEDGAIALISANLGNLIAGKEKILVTGTVDSDVVKNSIKNLNLSCDVKLNMFGNPSILKCASDYDGIVIVEQRNVSKRKMIDDQINLLKNSGTEIIGAIIL